MSDQPLLNDPGQTPVPHKNGATNLPARPPYIEVPPPVVLNGQGSSRCSSTGTCSGAAKARCS